MFATISSILLATRPKVFAREADVDVDDAPQLIVVDLGGRMICRDVRHRVEARRVREFRPIAGECAQVQQVSHLILRDTARSACNRCRSSDPPSSWARSSGWRRAR